MSDAPQPGCPHTRTRLIAKDNDAQYVECLDCGALLEGSELKQTAAEKTDPPAGPAAESLSDA
jgi:hypothetical protein